MTLADFKILSPTAILGYGFPEESFNRGMDEGPDLIAVDAGSVDPGPYYLGSGKSFTDRAGVKRDLGFLLEEAVNRGIPFVVGTAGGSGARPHLDWCEQIIQEIAEEKHLSFRMGIIPADVDKQAVIQAIVKGKVSSLSGCKALDERVVKESTHVVAQMGIEPIQQAFDLGCQMILAGRAYDPAAFAARPIMLGYDPGLALHLGKILECAAIAADPGSGADCVMGILQTDGFVLKPLSDGRVFTPASVAAHSLYEKSDPNILPGPGGVLDLTGISFTDIGQGQVRVSGSKFIPSSPYTIKLEGARQVGFRTLSLAGIRDPYMINQIDSILEKVHSKVCESLSREGIQGQIYFRQYGKNGVMGSLEPQTEFTGHELGLVIEAIGRTQKEADTLCSVTRSTLLHYGYPGRVSTAGNLAFPFSPSDIPAGPVYEFSIYHLMEVEPGQIDELFPVQVVEIGGTA